MKKLLAMLMSLLMLLSVCVPVLASEAVLSENEEFVYNAPSSSTDGHTFDDDFYFVEGIEKAPHSIEAWVYLPEDWDVSVRPGTLFSSYTGSTNSPYFHFDLYSNGGKIIPRIEFKDVYNKTVSSAYAISFTGISIVPGEWTHIAFSYDPATGKADGYKNGEFVETPDKTLNNTYSDIDDRAMDYSVTIGTDMRPSLDMNFKGSIHSMSLYYGQRTAADVKSAFLNGPTLDDKNLMGHFVLDNVNKDIKDSSKSDAGIWLDYSSLWVDESTVTNSDYSFAFLGDIQYLIENDAAFNTTQVKKMAEWIVANKDAKKIQYVMGLGDITEGDIPLQWAAAKKAIADVFANNIPYGLVNGNHDYGGAGKVVNTYKYNEETGEFEVVTETKVGAGEGLNQYFGADEYYASQFTEANGGGLYKEGDYKNSYRKMTIGETNWLFLHIDWDPTDDVLEWAGSIVEANPTYKVLITTHNYMHGDGYLTDAERTSSTVYNNTGVDIWNKLVRKYENISVVVSGHQEFNEVIMKQAKGDNGNTVSQFLVDSQMIDAALMGGRKTSGTYGYGADAEGIGNVTLFHFTNGGSEVQVEQYSVLKGKYYMTKNQFTFDMNEDEKIGESYVWGGAAEVPTGTGSATDPYIISSAGHLAWMATQIASKNITNGNSVSFDGKYFKQVCDIDLGKAAIKSIGYYHTSASNNVSAYAFGGHYDGGGFSIKNGRIVPATTGYGTNINWCGGLFGVIYGATIKNLTLDNVTVYSRGVTGGIVGRAIAPNDGSATAGYNMIVNCHVTENCDIRAYLPVGKSLQTGADIRSSFYDNRYNIGSVGSICGMAYATVIDGCSSDADIKVDENHGLVGGLVGTAGYNSIVRNSKFTGGITLTDGTDVKDGKDKSLVPFTMGGIVGLYAPNANTNTMYDKDNFKGGLEIIDCYNSGTFAYTDTKTLNRELQIGGILGNARALIEGFEYTIDNCHNLTKITAPANVANASVGGVIGTTSGSITFTESNCYDGTAATTPDSTTTAIADIDEVIKGQLTGFSVNGVLYNTLSAAVTAATAGDVIYMMSDMTSGTSKVTINKAITLDGRGGKLTYGLTGTTACGIATSANVTIRNFSLISGPASGGIEINKGTLNLENLIVEAKNGAALYVNATGDTNVVLNNAIARMPSDANNEKVVLYWSGASYNNTVTLKNGSIFQRDSKLYSYDRTNNQNYIILTNSTTANYTLNLESGSNVIANSVANSSNSFIAGFIHYKGNGSNIGITVNAEDDCHFINNVPSTIAKDFIPFYRGNPYSDFNLGPKAILFKDTRSNYNKVWNASDGDHYLSAAPTGTVNYNGTTYTAYGYCSRIVYGTLKYSDTIDNNFTKLITAAANDGTAETNVIKLRGDFVNTTGLVIPTGKTIVIDLNGYTMYGIGQTYMFRHVYGNLIIKNGNLVCSAGIWLDNGGSVTLKDVNATLIPNESYIESSGFEYSRPLLKAVKDPDSYVAGDVATFNIIDSTLTNKSNGECLLVSMDSGTAKANLSGNTKLIHSPYLRSGAATQNLSIISTQTSGNLDLTVGSGVELILSPVSDSNSTANKPSVINDHSDGTLKVTFENGSKMSIIRDGNIASTSHFVGTTGTGAGGTATFIDNGVVLYANANATKLGDGITLPTFTKANNTFIGFNIGGKLYAGGDNYKNANASGDVTFTAIYVDADDFTMQYGASLRTKDSAGIRYTSVVSVDLLNALGNNYTMGTILANTNITKDIPTLDLDSTSSVPEAVIVNHAFNESRIKDGYHYNRAALIGIPSTASAYTIVFAARGFITVTYADNTTMTLYTAYDANENNRSIYQVAKNLTANGNSSVVTEHIIALVENGSNSSVEA